jgi:hypothetical protein
MARIIDAFTQFLDDSGDPLVDGWLKFNETGTNNTDKGTFADINEQIPNANPVPLDGAGRAPNIFGTGSYSVISFKDSIITPGTPGDQIQQFDPVGGTLEGTAFADWNASTIYSIGDKVFGSDGLDYRSITNNNQNNNPTSSAANWERIQLGRIWNANVTYGAEDSAYGSDGKLYVSLAGSNLNNDPVADTGQAKWTSSSVVSIADAADIRAGRKNLLYGLGRLNTDMLTGSVVLSAAEYGHDGFRGGSAGCTYTFATSEGATTFTISAGSLEQEVLGSEIFPGANTHVMSWTGTVTGQIDGGGFAASGVTATLTGGTNAIVEWGTGTLVLMQLEKGGTATAIEWRSLKEERALSQELYIRWDDIDSVNAVITNGSITSATAIDYVLTVPVEMAATPALVISDAAHFQSADSGTVRNLTNVTLTALNTRKSFNLAGTGVGMTTGNGSTLRLDGTAGAFLALDARP